MPVFTWVITVETNFVLFGLRAMDCAICRRATGRIPKLRFRYPWNGMESCKTTHEWMEELCSVRQSCWNNVPHVMLQAERPSPEQEGEEGEERRSGRQDWMQG